jgi:hypothetical protein
MKTILPLLVLMVACRTTGGGAESRGVPAAASSGLLLRLERTLCFGSCPDYRVEVDTDGTVRYEGNLYVRTAGKASGHLDRAEVAALRGAIDQARFAETPVKCCDCLDSTDAPFVKITVVDGHPPKTIDDYHGCEATPKSIRELEDSIDRIIGTKKWIGPEVER